MTTSHPAQARSVELSGTRAAVWLALTAFLALLMLYFVDIDQGVTPEFGANTYVHEYVTTPDTCSDFPATNGPRSRIIGRGLVAGALAGVRHSTTPDCS